MVFCWIYFTNDISPGLFCHADALVVRVQVETDPARNSKELGAELPPVARRLECPSGEGEEKKLA